ncbi:MAG: DUF4270 family protein, partial [Bacteroidota bacterium]
VNIRSTGSTETMMAFDLDNNQSRIFIYYTKDGEARSVSLLLTFASFRTGLFTHDYSGAFVEPYLDNAEQADEFMFVQSMSGINLEIEWNDLTWLEGAVISKAELEFTVAELNNDDLEKYPPIERIFGHERGDDGEFVVSPDVFNAFAISNFNVFGGNVQDNADTTMQIYTFNVTDQLQEAIADQIQGNAGESVEFILSSYVEPETRLPNTIPLPTKAEVAQRTVFYGPKNSSFPAKLKVTYIKS